MNATQATLRMTARRGTAWLAITWTLGIVAMVCLCAAHFRLEWVRKSDVAWFGSHIAVGVIVAPLLWYGTAFMRYLALRTAVFAVQAIAAFGLYLVITAIYIFEVKGGPH